MKKPLSIIIIMIISAACYAQDVTRYMHSKIIGKDSAIIYFDEYYRLVEPNCAKIIRYGHYDTLKHHFLGKFKDIKRNDTSFTVSYGTYSENGSKEGDFVVYNIFDKKLQEKGSFKNNEYDGECLFNDIITHVKEKSNFLNGKYNGKRELYDESGAPLIFMNVYGDKFEITDVWYNGVKIVNNGKGNYFMQDGVFWRGKLLNGVPDGEWTFKVSEDVYGYEMFRHGKFISGYNHTAFDEKEYNERSRIHFLSRPPELRMLYSESLVPGSDVACDGTDYHKYQSYHYRIFNNSSQDASSPEK